MLGGSRPSALDRPRERRGRRRVDQDVEREPDAGLLAEAGEHLGDEQGVPAQLEEPVIAADALDPQDLAEQIGDPALELIARWLMRGPAPAQAD